MPSTQQVARQRVGEGVASPRAFAARRQSGGYGRHGRVWQSPPGGLWMTLAIPRPRVSAVDPTAGFRAAIGVAGAIDAALRAADPPLTPMLSIKWPNDLLLDGRKVCGILCEAFSHGSESWLLVGVGVNVNNPAPAILSDGRAAASLIDYLKAPIDVTTFAEDVAQRAAAALDAPLTRGEVEWAAARLWMLDRPILVRTSATPGDAPVVAVLRGLTDDARLVVEVAGARAILPPSSEVVATPS